ncbi:response regulator of citrate/malate metabolism [Sinobaca qinghaiensis]|uniref:Transcriptional regulatory protein n=1 Tax=Sinobaca qinghaiensis TaxID=342944 RepID=A0A419V0E7_9BACL|nr:response regulator [Sinobaca qinghaiensis]RKD71422.1 response regulator of citrate/malate metabolism [Sinobaca qinghaiensis]
MIRTAIAEDDFRIAQIHQEIVDGLEGFECTAKAASAAELLELLRTHPIKLLLLDVYMPDSMGVDLLHTIRGEYPEVDVIIVSASTNAEHIKKSFRYGVFDYIIKPGSLDRLKETLQKYEVFHQSVSTVPDMSQEDIDEWYSGTVPVQTDSPSPAYIYGEEPLPKGIDALTLRTVQERLQDMPEGTTAEEMGRHLGASRTTARRYLEFLISVDKGEAKPIYGIVGRPERRYFSR